jgi:hypothetical protein
MFADFYIIPYNPSMESRIVLGQPWQLDYHFSARRTAHGIQCTASVINNTHNHVYTELTRPPLSHWYNLPSIYTIRPFYSAQSEEEVEESESSSHRDIEMTSSASAQTTSGELPDIPEHQPLFEEVPDSERVQNFDYTAHLSALAASGRSTPLGGEVEEYERELEYDYSKGPVPILKWETLHHHQKWPYGFLVRKPKQAAFDQLRQIVITQHDPTIDKAESIEVKEMIDADDLMELDRSRVVEVLRSVNDLPPLSKPNEYNIPDLFSLIIDKYANRNPLNVIEREVYNPTVSCGVMYEVKNHGGKSDGLTASEFLVHSMTILFGGYARTGHAIIRFFPQQPVPMQDWKPLGKSIASQDDISEFRALSETQKD